jgi:flavin-dependent dehydrogenase
MAGGGARDVIVVGGGPAGSATAVILKQRGHDVLLLDEARFPRDKVCGEGVSPEAWRLLAAIGVDGAVRSLSPHPLRGMAVTAPDGSCFRGDYRGASQPGFAVRRERFDGVLLDRARDAGVEVREGMRGHRRSAERLERAILLSSPKAIGPLALEASRVSAPGALLVGDAAGFYDPFTGEGVTLALRSAVLAAEVAHRCLREAPFRAFRVLPDYDRLRHAATRHKFRFNRLLQVVIGRPWLANAAVRRLARRPDLADRMVSIAGDFVPARTALGPGFLLDLLSS